MDQEMSSQRFIRNSLLLITIEIMSKGLGVLFFIVVARFLGAGDLGIFAFATVLANFIVIPSKFGFEDLIQREVSRNPAGTYYYFWALGAIKGSISLISLGIFCLCVLLWARTDPIVLILAVTFTLVYSFMEFTDAFFRANQRAELELMVRLFFSVTNILLGITILYAGYRLRGVLSTQVASVGAAVILAIFILRRVATGENYRGEEKHRYELGTVWRHLAAAIPFAGILVALYFSNQIGVVILTFLSGKVAVGYFASAFRIFDALTLIAAAVTGAFLPTMSRYYIQSLGAFVRTLRFTLKYMFILTAPMVIITSLLAHRIIIFLYREPFAPSIPALQILGLSLVFSFWNFAGQSVLVARNRERLVLVSIWTVAAINVAANLLLIPGYSYLGACWAIFITQGAYCTILFTFLLPRYLGFRQLLRLIAIPALSAAIMGLAVYLLRQAPLFIVILAGMVVYGGALLALGGITAADQSFLRRLVTSEVQDLPVG
jgi:O-antigen/teichoic acid export membrane protein